MIMQLRKGKSVPINKLGESNVITDIPNKIGHRAHPTEKPIELFSRFILQSSKENEIVLDLFCGSGSCPLSCIKNNRRCIAVEIDKKFYDRMIERIKEVI